MSSLPGQTSTADVPPALDLSVFRQMADMSNDAFYLCDAHGRFLYVNGRSMTLGGYAQEELLELSVPDINPEFPRERFEAFVQSMHDGSVPPFETISQRKDGTLFPIEISAARIDIDAATYVFGVVRDISERKQLEAERKSFTQRMLQTLEAERQRVARELHDDVGQSIATVGVLLHALEQTPGSVAEEMRPALMKTHASIRHITESVARIVRDCHPAELLGLGLEDTLRSHVLQFTQRHRLVLELATVPTAGLLDHDRELHLYRIAQEALANVAHHAKARRVLVRLRQQRGRLVLTVRDDGVGFAVDVARASGGLGLVTMRERAELMGAELTVRSAAQHGTELRIAVPLAAHEPFPLAAGTTGPAAHSTQRRRLRVVAGPKS